MFQRDIREEIQVLKRNSKSCREIFSTSNEPSCRDLPEICIPMTWFGHCIVNVSAALRTLPSAGQLMLIRDLRDFLDRQEQEIDRRQRARRPKAPSI